MPKDIAARCAVLVGPQGAGKTTLLRALIARAEGCEPPPLDASDEAKEFRTTTEPNFARCSYLGDAWTFVDCPGAVELTQAGLDTMLAADVVIVVAEPNPDRAAGLSPYFRYLDEHAIPHVLFVNHLDDANVRVRDLLQALQTYSERPLVLRQVPIRENGAVVGAIDLVSERAWKYREGQQSELIEIPAEMRGEESQLRGQLLDALADFDDGLMEQILEDKVPPSDSIFKVMAKELSEDMVAPVLMGSASHGHGVTRLFKLLRHEAPHVGRAAERCGVNGAGTTVASVVRTMHVPHIGKISAARVWKGKVKDGDMIDGGRVSGLLALNGGDRKKQTEALTGDIIGLSRVDALSTGDLVVDGKVIKSQLNGGPMTPVFSVAIRPKSDKDDVKLSTALAKLCEEDSSLTTERRPDTGEFILRGQGDMHLRIAAAKLRNRYNLEMETSAPRPSYKETIRGVSDFHARHKKQSGGHGQFADIRVKIKPLSRGNGFQFGEEIHGGSVPRQFIPAVEAGVREGLTTGPLGFPVVDLAVTLYDGLHHPVDSNEMSFKMAGRQAMREALPDCQPVLLEPIYHTTIHAPREHTNKVHGVISGRRGQILGFDARQGWPGWDSVTAMMPESGIQDLIIELRSLSQGTATYEAKFDHYQELFGRDADKIVEERKAGAAARH